MATLRVPLVLIALCLTLAGCSRPVPDGCVDALFKTCIANVSLVVTDDSPAATEKEIARQTVSGVLNGDVSLYGHFADAPSHAVSVSIMVNNGKVLLIDVQTDGNDAAAETDAQYDRTDLYRIFQVLTGGKCNGEPLDKRSVYRFFQTKVKPARKRDPEPPHETAEHKMTTPKLIPFCGRNLGYMYSWGIHPDTIDANNPTGAYTDQIISLISNGAGFQ
jgi:hypothetical protein